MVTMAERITRVETKLESIESKLDEFIQCADKRYASKLSERVIYGLCAILLGAVVTALLRGVF